MGCCFEFQSILVGLRLRCESASVSPQLPRLSQDIASLPFVMFIAEHKLLGLRACVEAPSLAAEMNE